MKYPSPHFSERRAEALTTKESETMNAEKKQNSEINEVVFLAAAKFGGLLDPRKFFRNCSKRQRFFAARNPFWDIPWKWQINGQRGTTMLLKLTLVYFLIFLENRDLHFFSLLPFQMKRETFERRSVIKLGDRFWTSQEEIWWCGKHPPTKQNVFLHRTGNFNEQNTNWQKVSASSCVVWIRQETMVRTKVTFGGKMRRPRGYVSTQQFPPFSFTGRRKVIRCSISRNKGIFIRVSSWFNPYKDVLICDVVKYASLPGMWDLVGTVICFRALLTETQQKRFETCWDLLME